MLTTTCLRFGSIIMIWFLVPWLASAQENETVYSSDRVTAFRVRVDFNVDLDEDGGWAAGLNESTVQTVDRPFRIRFETESDSSVYRRQYSLQYRRNSEPWSYIEAHEFPYPSAASPPVSIVSCPAFFLGEEADDLIKMSTLSANSGAGISLSPVTPGWHPDPPAGASAEWEFALVIRRWADGPQTAEKGDVFSLRMVDHLGRPLPGPIPEISVVVPEKHLGGTFVETPARVGPYENSRGELYFIMEPTETDNIFMMVKSTDNGLSWSEVGADNRPQVSDLEGVGSVMSDDGIIHIVHQISEGVYYHAFATYDHPTAKDRWVVDSRLITRHEEPPTQTADITLRHDGSLVAVFAAGVQVQYSIMKPNGDWSRAVVFNHDYPAGFTNPSVVALPDGTIEMAYKSLDGIAWHRQLLPDNTLSPPKQFAENLGTTEDENIAILPLVYLPDKQTTVAVFRRSDGFLYLSYKHSGAGWSQPAMISAIPVAINTVDSDQTAADVVAWGDRIIVTFISETDRHIYFSVINDFDQIPEAELIISGIDGSWLRGNVLYNAPNAPVYGLIYDAGSKGGSGFNKYFFRELHLE